MIALRRAWGALILREEPDPASWLRRVRTGVEALGLCPAKCMTLPATLDHLSAEVIRYAADNGFTEERIREALRLPRVALCARGCCFECAECAAKPGSPVLCANCLARRAACEGSRPPTA